jgi:hypothetical protein
LELVLRESLRPRQARAEQTDRTPLVHPEGARPLIEAKDTSAKMAVTALAANEATASSCIYRDAIFGAPPKMQRRYVQAFVQ